jgi:hypothetical protein
MRMHLPIASLVEKAARDGLKEAGKAVLKRARELSPTDEGGADKSGFVVVDDLTVQVGFKSHIARIQHENLDFQHKPGEQAKFLEAAVDETDIGAIIAKNIRAALG